MDVSYTRNRVNIREFEGYQIRIIWAEHTVTLQAQTTDAENPHSIPAGENTVTILGVDIRGSNINGTTVDIDYSGWPCVWITNDADNNNEPEMPVMNARLTDGTDAPTLPTGNVAWNLAIEYVRGRAQRTGEQYYFYIQPEHVQNDCLPANAPDTTPTNLWSATYTTDIRRRSAQLRAVFPYSNEQGNNALGVANWWKSRGNIVENDEPIIRGGTGTFEFTYTVPDPDAVNEGTGGGVITGKRAIHIRGVNPPVDDVEDYIQKSGKSGDTTSNYFLDRRYLYCP